MFACFALFLGLSVGIGGFRPGHCKTLRRASGLGWLGSGLRGPKNGAPGANGHPIPSSEGPWSGFKGWILVSELSTQNKKKYFMLRKSASQRNIIA
jgi:hypothetical protein